MEIQSTANKQREDGVFRSLSPFFLSCIGLVILVSLLVKPGLVWKVDLLKADFSPDYRVEAFPEHWETRIGESLEDEKYRALMGRVIYKVNQPCMVNSLSIEIVRSDSDRMWESLIQSQVIPWLSVLILGVVMCSALYSVWAVRVVERESWGYAIAASLIGIFIFSVIMIFVLALLGPAISVGYMNLPAVACEGSMTLSASIVGFDPNTALISIIGLVFEALGVFIMVRQWRRAKSLLVIGI